MTDQTFGKNRRSILLLITAGLVLMLVSTLSYFSANPGLVSHTTTGTQAAAPSGQQMPTSAGMDEATQQGVMALMQKLQKNPTDLEALVLSLIHIWSSVGWKEERNFFQKFFRVLSVLFNGALLGKGFRIFIFPDTGKAPGISPGAFPVS